MTKKDIIKQEIMGTINVPQLTIPLTENGSYGVSGQFAPVVTVDIDKLATLLAKHLDIKIEDEELELKK